jgi:hypothetical protein
VFGGAQFESGDEFLIEVADNQLGHENHTIAMISQLSMRGANRCQPTTVELRHYVGKIATR